MDKSKFTFKLVDTLAPDIVIRNALKQIEEVTEGYVSGTIDTYDGPIHNYTKITGWAAAVSALQKSSEVSVDIQESLGEQGSEDHRYEVYLSAKELKHYKYRIMFLQFGTVSYPAKIVMNDDLATICFGKLKNTFEVESMAALEELINAILESEIMVKLIQNLINESLRKQAQVINSVTEVVSEDSE